MMGDGDEYALYTSLSKPVGYHGITELFDVYLVRTKDGVSKITFKEVLDAHPEAFSGGKYIFWFDVEKKAFFSYDIHWN